MVPLPLEGRCITFQRASTAWKKTCCHVQVTHWNSSAMYNAQVVIYHGPKRGLELDSTKLSEADVVLTTYSIIESEYRRQEMTTGKVCCAFCNKRLYPHKLRLHLRCVIKGRHDCYSYPVMMTGCACQPIHL